MSKCLAAPICCNLPQSDGTQRKAVSAVEPHTAKPAAAGAHLLRADADGGQQRLRRKIEDDRAAEALRGGLFWKCVSGGSKAVLQL